MLQQKNELKPRGGAARQRTIKLLRARGMPFAAPRRTGRNDKEFFRRDLA